MDLVISSSTSSSLFRVLGHCYILAYDVCIKLFWHKEVEGTLGERNPLHSNCNKNRWHQEALFLPLSLHECGTACVALGLVLAYLSIKIKLIRIKFESTCSNNEAARPKVLVQSGTTQVVFKLQITEYLIEEHLRIKETVHLLHSRELGVENDRNRQNRHQASLRVHLTTNNHHCWCLELSVVFSHQFLFSRTKNHCLRRDSVAYCQ